MAEQATAAERAARIASGYAVSDAALQLGAMVLDGTEALAESLTGSRRGL